MNKFQSILQIVLENMISGVILIDADGQIILINRAAEETLGLQVGEALYNHVKDIDQPIEFTRLIERCSTKRIHQRGEVTYDYPSERIMEMNAIPLQANGDAGAGVLIVLHDITAVRRLERVRSEFVANVSHELKTPVAAVRGFAETLLAGAIDDKETAKSFLQIIYDESDRINRLIEELMDLSNIESKRVPLQFSPVHLHSIIADTMQMMRAAANAKRIQIDMNVDEKLYIEADEDRLRQIMINLLSNGINYTPEGGNLYIEVVPVGDRVEYERIVMTIADTGIGIPQKDLPRVFERFYRVDKARSRGSGGTGLGLSIVKHLVELHKGTIRVESEAGIGTRFMIELPAVHEGG